MTTQDRETHKFDQKIKLAIYISGLLVAMILSLFHSPYAGEAFALLAGLVGGNALKTE